MRNPGCRDVAVLRLYIHFHQMSIDRRRAQSANQMPMTIEEAEAELERRFGQQAS
ncbi:hypothetical protein [Nostoc sp.]|uniref:hypothetical protein n=1 Tax=Nostoc sp. TaxID=1180 RepID=UPI002FFA1F5F